MAIAVSVGAVGVVAVVVVAVAADAAAEEVSSVRFTPRLALPFAFAFVSSR